MSAAKLQRKATEVYQQSIDVVLAALSTGLRLGLSEAEAQARLEKYGRNELTAEKPVPAWRKFLAQFQDVLVIVLLIATLISAGLWLHERDAALPYEAVIYVPFLQQAFSTASLSFGDWLYCAAVASSVLWLGELSKMVTRQTANNQS